MREEARVTEHRAATTTASPSAPTAATYRARSVLLATGVINHRPPGMDDALHDEALARGLLRYCPVCDGYEVTDKRVAVIGTGNHGTAEALFLRGYTADITLISPRGRARARRRNAKPSSTRPASRASPGPAAATRSRTASSRSTPPTGAGVRQRLSGARLAMSARNWPSTPGAHDQRRRLPGRRRPPATNVPGLFAAGDVVKGLDQISHAMGEGGVAATTIRNYLAETQRLGAASKAGANAACRLLALLERRVPASPRCKRYHRCRDMSQAPQSAYDQPLAIPLGHRLRASAP